ncbi:TIGR03619 family F420-dependent LLM class oxidoreductase [Dactylosporangium sp. NPDC000555]|uniref:TIGR03619 family F420-dependent LLM class oxidoreductase n=1 Tax=Dactylosporangium sp. NPDC000555 TaxID=3154260 RepID=UPI003321FF9F
MRFGLFMVPTARALPPQEFGRLAEELGYECVLVPQHTHVPAAQDTAFPLGGDLPDEYRHVFDPLVTLTAIAAATATLKVGTGVCLVLQNDLVTLAKAVATLDQLSGGRVLFGVGAGWNAAEMRTHGVDPATRMPAMVEAVRALQAIWGEDEASYTGKHLTLAPLHSWPKPVQRPHPPVLVGGNHRNMLRRVVTLGAGWMPNAGKFDPDRLDRMIGELFELAESCGRPRPGVTVFRAIPRPQTIERYAAAGAERCVFALPDASPADNAERIRGWSGLVERFA